MQPLYSLKDFSSDRLRNILRGIVSTTDDQTSIRTINNLRREANLSEFYKASIFLFQVPQGKLILPYEPFPTCLEEVRAAPFWAEARPEIELAFQCARVLLWRERLVEAVKSLKLINESVLSADHKAIAASLDEHVAKFGLSLTIMKKAISLKHSELGGDLQKTIANIAAPFFLPKRHILAVGFEDSVDQEIGYIVARRRFLEHANRRRLQGATMPLIVDMFSPHQQNQMASSAILQAYGRWGLTDTLAYIKRMIYELEAMGKADTVSQIENLLPADINSAWSTLALDFDVEKLGAVLGGEPDFLEYRLFAHSPAWDEIPKISKYRTDVERAIGQRLDGLFPVRTDVNSDFCEQKESIAALLPKTDFQLDLDKINPRSCGKFHRSIALITSTSGRSLPTAKDGQELLTLLDHTVDVPTLFSPEEVRNLLPENRNDKLYNYLKTALVNDAEGGRISAHAFRRATQDVVSDNFGGEIVEFAEYLDKTAPHVANHFHGECDEFFLTELYTLFPTPEDVIEAQARILEWYGEARNHEVSVIRAKSVRLNLKLRKVLGTIDDTRIYVDPLRFRQWGIDTVGASLRELSSAAEAIKHDPCITTDLHDPIQIIQRPSVNLLDLIDRCYREFCTNKFYGVDSYIGRRIRHGTLRGVLVAELKPLVDEIIASFRYKAPSFSRFMSDWFQNLDSEVRQFGGSALHVLSDDKPSGLIRATVDDKEKQPTLAAMYGAVVDILNSTPQIAPAISIIYEYCWLLLEIDLKRARKAAEAIRVGFVLNPNDHRKTSNSATDQEISETIRRLNSEVQQRFEALAGWLSRPSTISPSASIALLFEAVISEVQGRYSGAYPKIVSTGRTDIDLFGHRFHTLYDALYIIVDNAIRHGASDGQLTFNVTLKDLPKHQTEISLNITSEFASEKAKYCKERIEEAMGCEIGDAMREHTKSGLRKVRLLADDSDEITGFSVALAPNSATFTITMQLAMT